MPERAADITDLVSCLIVTMDARTRVLTVNRACEEAIGSSGGPVAGRTFAELFVAPADIPTFKAALGELEQGPLEFESALPPARAMGRSIAWTIQACSTRGTVARLVATGTDVTRFRRQHEQDRQAAELFRMAVAHSPDLIFYQDTDLRFTWLSRTIPPLQVTDVVGKVDADFIGPEEAARHAAIKRRVMQTGIGERAEARVRIGGEWHYLETAIERRVGPDGKVLGIAGYARDVTEYKRAQEQLRAINETLEQRVAQRTADLQAHSEALAHSQQELERQTRLLELIVQSMGDGVVVVDKKGRFVLFNPAAERIVGYHPIEVPLAQWSEHFGFFLPDRVTPYPADQLPLQRSIRGEAGGEAEIFVRSRTHPEGAWVATTSRPILDEQGRPAGAVAVLHDLTARKRAEEALRLSEKRLRLLIEQAPISIQTFSPDGFIRDVNRAWERLFGVTPADIPGYNVLEDRQLVEKGLMPQIRSAFAGEPVAFEPMFYVPDRGPFVGLSLWMQAWAYPVRDETGQVCEVVLIHQDITARKNAEDKLRESERHYRDLADYNRRLVREVEHRVRNNLTGLIGLVDVMRQRAPDVATFASAIEGRLRALAHVHDLLATTGWKSVGLRRLVSSTLSALQHMAPHPASQEISGPDISVPPGHVSPLTMILVEWFTNSCKYGAHSRPGGSLRVRWESPDGHVRLTWRELGGPPAPPPGRPSLGTELVHAFATRELGGHCRMSFGPDGASHLLEFPTEDGPDTSR